MTVGLDGLAELAALAYLLVLVLAALDVVFPVLPSESVVVLGAVLASQGRLSVLPLLAAAAAGAIAGDHLSYALGRSTRGLGRRDPTGRAQRLRRWARHQLDTRGPIILVVGRFVPGGRTASTLMAGQVALPLRTYSPLTVIAGALWAGFGVLLGTVGGATFHDQTLLATVFGIALGVGTAAIVQAVVGRRVRPLDAVPGGDDDITTDRAA
ncbi:MAG: DedA family protein [Acidimicrobiia bacterium]